MNVSNAREMSNLCKNPCIKYVGGLHLALYFLWYFTNIAVL
jgi:hypothetical protein